MKKLLGAHRSYTEPREPEASFTLDLPSLDNDAHVVVISSILLSGETANRCMGRVLLNHAKPLVLACLIDARRDPGVPIKKWGMSIPVIGLTQAKIIVEQVPPNDPRIRDINPITGDFEDNVLWEESEDATIHFIPPRELYKMVSEENALHFNHICRGVGRHFTFYLDAEKLINNPRIMEAFTSTIRKWKEALEKTQETDFRIDLMYPAPESPPSSPARKLSFALWDQDSKTFNKPRLIHRNAAFGQWLFSKPDEGTIGRTVTIIDWGSLSGASLMQMIHSAAEAGADHILACIFLCQLPAHEKRLLTSLSTLTVQRRQTENKPLQTQLALPFCAEEFRTVRTGVRVDVKFISALPIRAFSQHDCPVCQRKRQLQKVSETWAKEFIPEYCQKRVEELQRRDREDVIKQDPLDFRGAPIPGDRIVEMLKLRERLEKAQTFTAWREKIRIEIDGCMELLTRVVEKTSPPAKVLELLHLLAVETHWLKLAPLNIGKLRQALARIAYLTAINEDAKPSDRLNALTVLRNASKPFFIEKFQELFKALVEIPGARNHLLYDAASYLSRPYHQTAEMLGRIRDQIVCTQLLVNQGEISVDDGERTGLGLLLNHAELAYAQAEASPKTLPEAWRALKHLLCEDYRKGHHRVSSHFDKLIPGPADEDILIILGRQEPIPIDFHPWLRSVADTWITCQDFLDQEILPLLVHLESLILSEEGERAFGGKARCQKLHQMIEDRKKNISLADSSFSATVKDISRFSETPIDVDQWKQFCDGIYWHGSLLLNPGFHENDPSALIMLLNSAPSKLGPIFEDIYKEKKDDLGSHDITGLEKIVDSDQLVLCSKFQLRELISELFTNCRKHAPKKSCHINIKLDLNHADDGIVTIGITNKPISIVHKKHGLGLIKAKNRLNGYGASIKFQKSVERDTHNVDESFTIEIQFLKGNNLL
jgi:hypothetical protein